MILRHLGLWDIHNHDPPQAFIADPIPELVYAFSASQIPAGDIGLDFSLFAGFPVRCA